MRLVWQAAALSVLAAGAGGYWYGLPYLNAQDVPPAEAARQAQRPNPVVAAAARRGPVETVLEAVGTLAAREAVTLTARQSGTVKAIRFEEDQWVERGAILVELDDAEARANLAGSEAQRRNAAQLLERTRTLLGRGAAPEARVSELQAELDRAEANVRAARARLDDLVVTAPFAGRTGLRRVSPGALVTPGSAITTLDDTRVVRLAFRVPERELGRLRAGLPVTGLTDAFPNTTFQGTVRAVDSRVDPVTRSVEVIAEIPNPEARLRPGMFLNVNLAIDRREDAILMPEEALVPLGERQFVWVVGKDDRSRRREVSIGRRVGGEVEVTRGLEAGEMVVTRGVHRLREGSPVSLETAPGVGS